MLFLTYQLAGNEWLSSRLSLFSRCTLGKQLNVIDALQAGEPTDAITVLQDAAMPPSKTKLVNLIRNPLAMLARSQQQSLDQTYDLPNLVAAMVSNAAFAKSHGNINVRLEDFAAFPVVHLKAICDFFEQPCTLELVRAFLDADRPIRKSRRLIRVAPSQSSSKNTGTSSADFSSKRDKAVIPSSERIDLFSWVDEISAVQAQELVDAHQAFFASYYPEVLRVCQSSDRVRQVG